MSTLTLTIPKQLWLSANHRLHWAERARRTKSLRQMGYLTACAEKVPPMGLTAVTAFIAYPRNGKADPANSAPTVKALIDGMADAGVWPDDDSTHVLGPTFLRDPSTKEPGIYRVRLVLVEQEVAW